MSILRACADWRVIAILAAVGVGVAVFAPNLIAAAVPLLIVAVCPLSMLAMMRAMAGHPATASPGQDRTDDRPSQLRERLAATRLEQQQLERKLARLESVEQVRSVEGRGNVPAADAGAGPS